LKSSSFKIGKLEIINQKIIELFESQAEKMFEDD